MATSFCGKTTGLLDEGYSANGGKAEACTRRGYCLLAAMRVEAPLLNSRLGVWGRVTVRGYEGYKDGI